MTPQAPFTEAMAGYVEKLADWNRKLTKELIQAVRADGWVRVRDTFIPVTGKVPLLAGQMVDVMWRYGKPQVALMNAARRGGGDVLLPVLGAPIIEELFRVEREDGLSDIWFRNDTVFAKILEGLPPEFTASTGFGLHWGTGNSNYFCVEGIDQQGVAIPGSAMARVYRLNRPQPNEPFPAGMVPTVELVKEYDFGLENSDVGPTFGTMTLTLIGSDTAIATGPVQYRRTVPLLNSDEINVGHITTHVQYAGLGEQGELLIKVNAVGVASNVANVFLGQMLVNAETGTVLAQHMAVFITGTKVLEAGPVTVTGEMSAGVADSEAGELDLLSVRTDPVTQALTFNNYLLLVRAAVITGAAWPAQPLRLLGEFAQLITTIPAGTETGAVWQGSRTRLLWTGTTSGALDAPLRLTRFRNAATTVVGADSTLVFGLGGGHWEFAHARALVVGGAGLTFSPAKMSTVDTIPTPDFSVSFFPAGAASGQFTVETMVADGVLSTLGTLKPVTKDSEEEGVLFLAEASALQILNSQAGLGPLGLHQDGPL